MQLTPTAPFCANGQVGVGRDERSDAWFGLNDSYALTGASHAACVLQQLKHHAGLIVLVEETISAAKNPRGTPVIELRNVKRSER